MFSSLSSRVQSVSYTVNIFRTEDAVINTVKSNAIGSKRPYLTDYKAFSTVILPKTIGINVAKAGVLTFSLFLLEFNKYLDRQIQNRQNDEDGIKLLPDDSNYIVQEEEFDWEEARRKYSAFLFDSSLRSVGTSFIRKFYELIAVTSLDIRIADRLHKDALKSFSRKCTKFTRFQAAFRLFKTVFWSSILLHLSSFTYDVIYNIVGHIQDKTKRENISAQSMLIWTVKKASYYSVVILCSSAGFSVGAYVNADVGSVLMAAVFETVGSSVASAGLGL